jgi:hypothetical protein
MKRFLTFLNEAEYNGKIVSLDHPFNLRDDPDNEKGVYVQDPESHETKLVRYGKKDADSGKVGPKANPKNTTPGGKPEKDPDKTSPSYWDDKDDKDDSE